jgi:hypothetical protein
MYQWMTGGCAAAALVWKLTDKSLSTWGFVPPGTLAVSIGSGRAPIKEEWWGYPLLVVDDVDGNQLLLPRYDRST